MKYVYFLCRTHIKHFKSILSYFSGAGTMNLDLGGLERLNCEELRRTERHFVKLLGLTLITSRERRIETSSPGVELVKQIANPQKLVLIKGGKSGYDTDEQF